MVFYGHKSKVAARLGFEPELVVCSSVGGGGGCFPVLCLRWALSGDNLMALMEEEGNGCCNYEVGY